MPAGSWTRPKDTRSMALEVLATLPKPTVMATRSSPRRRPSARISCTARWGLSISAETITTIPKRNWCKPPRTIPRRTRPIFTCSAWTAFASAVSLKPLTRFTPARRWRALFTTPAATMPRLPRIKPPPRKSNSAHAGNVSPVTAQHADTNRAFASTARFWCRIHALSRSFRERTARNSGAVEKQMSRVLNYGLIAVAAVLMASSASAHHSHAMFDLDKQVDAGRDGEGIPVEQSALLDSVARGGSEGCERRSGRMGRGDGRAHPTDSSRLEARQPQARRQDHGGRQSIARWPARGPDHFRNRPRRQADRRGAGSKQQVGMPK